MAQTKYDELLRQLIEMPAEAFRTPDGSTLVLSSRRSPTPAAAIDNFSKPSGGEALNALQAQNSCHDAPGRYTLEHTKAGRWLADNHLENPFKAGVTRKEAQALVSGAHQRLVECARGDIETFAVGATRDDPLRTTMLPTALSNPQIKSINGVPKADIEKLSNPDMQYDKVVRSEFSRDAHRGEQWKETVKAREQHHERFMDAERSGKDEPRGMSSIMEDIRRIEADQGRTSFSADELKKDDPNLGR